MFDTEKFAEALNKRVERREIQQKTAVIYLRCIDELNFAMMFTDIVKDKLPTSAESEKLIHYVAKGSPSRTNQLAAAIRVYSECLYNDKNLLLSGMENYRIWKFAKGEPKEPQYSYRNHSHRINIIHDEETRVAMKTQLLCGVRISELCRIRKSDVDLEHHRIRIRRDKGGGSKVVYLVPDEYLDRKLKEWMENLDDEDLLFPHKEHIVDECTRLGIITHDNRKHYIRERYKERVKANLDRGMKRVEAKNEALEWTRKIVGHSDVEKTKYYLGNVWRKRPKKKGDE